MASLGHEIPTTTSSDRYAAEAQQVLLRVLDGSGGEWQRHEPRTNLADLIHGSANENREGAAA